MGLHGMLLNRVTSFFQSKTLCFSLLISIQFDLFEEIGLISGLCRAKKPVPRFQSRIGTSDNF